MDRDGGWLTRLTSARRGAAPALTGRVWRPAVAIAVSVVLAIFFFYPVGKLIARGLIVDSHLDLSGFSEVFARRRTHRILRQTLIQGVAGTAGSLILGIPGAYVFYRLRFPGQRLARALVMVPFVLPTVVVGVAFRTLLAPGGPYDFLGWDRSGPAVIAACIFFNYAVVVRIVGSMWASLDPRPAQVAASLGASPARVWATVTIPALTPAIASAAGVIFMFCITAYGTVQILGGPAYGTIETEIWMQTAQFLDLRAAAVLSIVQLVVIIAGLAIARRFSADTTRALSAATPRPRRPQLRDLPALAITVVVAVGLLIAPLATMGARSLRVKDAGGRGSGTHWGLDYYRGLSSAATDLTNVTVGDAIANSWRMALQASALALTVGIAVALVLSITPRSKIGRFAHRIFDLGVMLPLGVSAVTLGFGFLIALNSPPFDFRSSSLLIPIAQAMVALPLVVRTILPSLQAINPRLREAAASLGASPWRVLRTVDLTALARPLGTAIGMAVAVSLGEFGATSFLARPETPTLPVVIFRLIGRPGPEPFGMAVAAATLLALSTGLVLAVSELIKPREARFDIGTQATSLLAEPKECEHE